MTESPVMADVTALVEDSTQLDGPREECAARKREGLSGGLEELASPALIIRALVEPPTAALTVDPRSRHPAVGRSRIKRPLR